MKNLLHQRKHRKYSKRKHSMLLTYCIAAFMVSFFIALQIQSSIVYAQAEATKPFLIDPSPSVSSLDNYSSVGQGKEAEGKNPIEQEIKQVFGDHYAKAMLLLKGNGKPGACSENKTLNIKALNDNTKWGGKGKDWGVFQINDKWQGITHEGKAKQFLLDPHINIRIAWRLYEDSGYSFRLWTCGRIYGI
jgi:hypothetical protein